MIETNVLSRSRPNSVGATVTRAAILLCGLFILLAALALIGGRFFLRSSEEVAYASDRSGSAEIYRMDINRGISFQLTFSREDNLQPSWSPDGAHIAFVSQRDGNAEIYIMNSDGSHTRRVTNYPGSDLYPSWSPDSQSIIYNLGRSGLTRIVTTSTEGGLPEALSGNNSAQINPSWSPDGEQVAFVSAGARGDTDIFVMDGEGKNFHAAISTRGNDVMPSWLPDGRLMFVSDWQGFSIQVAEADKADSSIILLHSVNRLGYPVWSPDNHWVAFSLFSSGHQSNIFVMEAACTQLPDSCTATMHRLTTQHGSETSPTWKP